MFRRYLLPVLCLWFVKSASSLAVSNQFNSGITVCGSQCEKKFAESPHKVVKACTQGCRLFPALAMSKDVHDTHFMNRTVKLCETSCSETFSNETLEACTYACNVYPTCKGSEKELESLRKILTMMYLKSDSLSHTARQFLKGNMAVFLNQQTGKFYVIESGGETIEISTNDESSLLQPSDVKLGWMECLSHQSGIPRWLLVVLMLFFIVALLWLCLVTAVSAPSQYITASKKKDMGYILICEPNNDDIIKTNEGIYIDDDEEEAPPLPPKISLI